MGWAVGGTVLHMARGALSRGSYRAETPLEEECSETHIIEIF